MTPKLEVTQVYKTVIISTIMYNSESIVIYKKQNIYRLEN